MAFNKEQFQIYVSVMNEPMKGAWFTLPISERKVYAELQRQFGDIANDGEIEYEITDYEAPFRLDTNTSIDQLNGFIDQLHEVDLPDELIRGMIAEGLFSPDTFEPEDLLDIHYIKADSDEDLAYEVLDEQGGPMVLSRENLEYYFDYDAYGRDLVLGGNYIDVDGYYVVN
jgi:antirestriction protein